MTSHEHPGIVNHRQIHCSCQQILHGNNNKYQNSVLLYVCDSIRRWSLHPLRKGPVTPKVFWCQQFNFVWWRTWRDMGLRQNCRNFAADIFKCIFSCLKMYKLRLRFHWSLFLRLKLTLFQHWLRWWLGTDQATAYNPLLYNRLHKYVMFMNYSAYWSCLTRLSSYLIKLWPVQHTLFFALITHC